MVRSRDVRGVIGGILLTATENERVTYEDLVRTGMKREDAAQVIARRIQERTKGFAARL